MELGKTIKEFLRVSLIAIVSYALTEGVIAGVLDATIGVRLDASAKVILVGFITALVKAVDRELHDSGVAEKGIIRF